MSYIGQQLPADVFSGYVTDTFTGDGSATTFTLSKAPFSEDSLIVVVDNVIQQPTTNFTVSGTTLTIVGTAILSGIKGYAIHTGGAIPITTPGDNSVTSAKLSGNLVTPGTLDVNGQELILDADADTSITADTDDQIDFKAGGTDTMHIINGKVGIGTSSPSTNLHIFSTADNAPHLLLENFQNADTDDAAVIELYLNDETTGGIGDNTDVGVIRFTGDEKDGGTKETYAEIRGVAHDPGSGSSNRGNLSFFVQKAGSLAETMTLDDSETVFNDGGQDHDFRIENDNGGNLFNLQANNTPITSAEGCIGFNTANSDGNFFEINSGQGNVYTANFINSENDASKTLYGLKIFFNAQNKDDQSSLFLVCQDTGTVRLKITSDGDVLNHDNAFGGISDERVKEQVTDASSQWDDVKAMKIRKYKMKDDVAKGDSDANWRLGVIAQELEASNMNGLVVDETKYTEDDQEVAINKTANAGDIKSYKSVKYSVLYMKAIKALQEAMAKIETLETKVKALEDA